MQVRRKFTRLALAALTTAGIAAVAAPNASAATAQLSITPYEWAPGYWQVSVGGQVAGTYPQGFDAVIRIWGEDEWFDDRLATTTTTSTPYDKYYGKTLLLSRATLNEDPEGRDEIYAGVRIYDRRTGSQAESVESNRFHWYF